MSAKTKDQLLNEIKALKESSKAFVSQIDELQATNKSLTGQNGELKDSNVLLSSNFDDQMVDRLQTIQNDCDSDCVTFDDSHLFWRHICNGTKAMQLRGGIIVRVDADYEGLDQICYVPEGRIKEKGGKYLI